MVSSIRASTLAVAVLAASAIAAPIKAQEVIPKHNPSAPRGTLST